MLESTRLTQAVEKRGRLQLAIEEWQRQLVEAAIRRAPAPDRLE
jgi:hypothetical protein